MAGKPKNHGKEWTNKDVKKLRGLANMGTTTPQIAHELGRTVGAVRNEASDKNITLKPKDN